LSHFAGMADDILMAPTPKTRFVSAASAQLKAPGFAGGYLSHVAFCGEGAA
jgi:hypothetical protein